MHALLFNYINDGSGLEQLKQLDFPLADGTTYRHVQLVTALHRKYLITGLPEHDVLAKQIIDVYNLMWIWGRTDQVGPRDTEQAIATITSVLNPLEQLQEKSADDYLALSRAYFLLGEQASDLAPFQSALSNLEKISPLESKHYHVKAMILSNIALLQPKISLRLMHCQQAMNAFIQTSDRHVNDYETLALAYKNMRTQFYLPEFEPRFFHTASLCLQRRKIDPNNNALNNDAILEQYFKATLATLNSNALKTKERRIYLSAAINLMEFLKEIHRTNTMPDNIINKWLTEDTENFEEALMTLKAIDTFNLKDVLLKKQNEYALKQLDELSVTATKQEKEISDLRDTKTKTMSFDEKITKLNNQMLTFKAQGNPKKALNKCKEILATYSGFEATIDDDYRLMANCNDDLAEATSDLGEKFEYKLEQISALEKITQKTQQDCRDLIDEYLAAIKLNIGNALPRINRAALAHKHGHQLIKTLLQIEKITLADRNSFASAFRSIASIHPNDLPGYPFWHLAGACFSGQNFHPPGIINDINRLINRTLASDNYAALRQPLADLISLLLKACVHPVITTYITDNKAHLISHQVELRKSPTIEAAMNHLPAKVIADTSLSLLAKRASIIEVKTNKIAISKTSTRFFSTKRKAETSTEKLADESKHQTKKPNNKTT